MPTPAHPRRFYQFGEFRLDPGNRVLFRDGEVVPLSPVVVETLRVLVENRGNAFGKDELLRAVWPDTFVEETNLTHNISVLRKVLGEAPGEQRFIQTIPKRGYRFVAAVTEIGETLATESPTPEQRSQPNLTLLRRLFPTSVLTRWGALAVTLGSLATVTGSAYLFLWRPTAQTPGDVSYRQLTEQPGQELYPSLSPDGSFFVYMSRASGNWDIYLQRVGGKAPINLTRDSLLDDSQPVFSPDGTRIAFRSERNGGGIFVMGATGESIRQITNFGYNPAWSPDGIRIVCATVAFQRPDYRPYLGSRLYAVEVLSGQKRPLTGLGDDAVQPHWSPGGHRIAYWKSRNGQRDIWVVRADGSDPAPVTRDASLDWNPVWSPDGKHLYFSSDRGGSMNLWRVPLNEKSGKVLGPLEPVTTPSPFSGYISVSGDGQRLAYVQQVRTVNLERIAFDAVTQKVVGPPVAVTQGLKIVWSPASSSNGKWVAFSTGNPREDIFVIRPDGTGKRQLTDDPEGDRMPVWSPDDKRIAFCSMRSGKWEIWAMNVDGSGLQQLSHVPDTPVVGPTWSPDGTRLACSRLGGDPLIIEADRGWKHQKPQALPPVGERDVFFAPRSWSPDGKMLAGDLRRPQGASSGLMVYSLSEKRYEQIAGFGAWPRWLHDSRRLVFHDQSSIYLIDTLSRRIQKIYSAVPREIECNQSLGVSRDGRQIFFSSTVAEADIWQLTRK